MYHIKFSRPAEKDYKKLPREIAERVDKAIKPLADEPRPANCKKLQNSHFYRIRVGDYRILYEIKEDTVIILVLRIRHRKEVYKNIH